MTTPCDGKCECVDPCPSCPTRPGWLGLSVPAYAVEQMGEEWLRARAATVPFRIPFSDRRAALRDARLRGKPEHADSPRQVAQGESNPPSTGPVSGSPARREGGR